MNKAVRSYPKLNDVTLGPNLNGAVAIYPNVSIYGNISYFTQI